MLKVFLYCTEIERPPGVNTVIKEAKESAAFLRTGSRTSFAVDGNDLTLSIENIMLPASLFFKFLTNNLTCRHCKCDGNMERNIKKMYCMKKKNKKNIKVKKKTNQKYLLEVFGVAHNLFYECLSCGFQDITISEISFGDNSKRTLLEITTS